MIPKETITGVSPSTNNNFVFSGYIALNYEISYPRGLVIANLFYESSTLTGILSYFNPVLTYTTNGYTKYGGKLIL